MDQTTTAGIPYWFSVAPIPIRPLAKNLVKAAGDDPSTWNLATLPGDLEEALGSQLWSL